MSEWNTIYNNKKEIVGTFRHGIAWSRITGERLGKYDKEKVYDNSGSVLANIVEDKVLSTNGEELGRIKVKKVHTTPEITGERNVLIINGTNVGECIGYHEAAAASIVFLGNVLSEQNS